MKKIILSLLLGLMITCSFGLIACNSKQPEHMHVYNQKIASEDFIATEATCTTKAKYYYSCECGDKGTETFEYGNVLEHSCCECMCNCNSVNEEAIREIIKNEINTAISSIIHTSETVIAGNAFNNKYPISGYYTSAGFVETKNFKCSELHIFPNNQIGGTLYFRATISPTRYTVIQYKEDGTFINTLSFKGLTSGEEEMNKNCAMFRVYTDSNYSGMVYLSTDKPSQEIDYEYKETSVVKTKPLYGKQIVNFGDSIFGMFQGENGANISISKLLENRTGGTFLNAGFGGCRMTPHEPYWDAFSMYRLADAIASGDWSLQEKAVIQKPTLPRYFSTTVEKLKGVIWENVDIITIAYGTNDYTASVPIKSTDGQFANEYEYYEGALKYSMQKILTAYPHIKIVVITPTYRFFEDDGVFQYDCTDVKSKNKLGYMLSDYVDACMSVCKCYLTLCIDNYYSIGMNRWNYLNFFNYDDGTHPNRVGRENLANRIASQIISNL